MKTALLVSTAWAGLMGAGLLAIAQPRPTLKEAFQGKFLVGAALNPGQFSGQDARGAALVAAQFNSITPENVLKWERVHPQPEVYDFDAPDRYVAFGEKNGMFIVGHTLVWHSQTPRWVFDDGQGAPLTREALLKRMRDHIQTVVGRYRGRIRGWDVVNEALDDDGTPRQSPWMKIIGEDYIAKAFAFAHEADPKAELYYNDYSIETGPKLKGAIELVTKLKAQGVPVAGVGLQGHYKMDWPLPGQVDEAIRAFEKLGVKTMITELDIDMLPAATGNRGADVSLNAGMQAKLDPYASGLPDAVGQALAKRYADLFAVFVKHHGEVTRVTFWGVTDGDSWLNDWPVKGRVSYPLLFDRKGRPKAAFDAVIKTAK